ncbi:DUF1667 domain-containing protein [Clostridia bacterium OttesenSCG-928-F22]|nr:DUF1667 domain-containing protein [Clostridia bacterium OttesenSCG-928-F22]
MVKEFTCVLCPNSCVIEATIQHNAVTSISGNLCPRGQGYVEQEIINPMRTIASSVLVKGGELPLLSVRTSGPIPRPRMMDVMAEIRKAHVQAPINAGDIIITDVLGLKVDIIATKTIAKK